MTSTKQRRGTSLKTTKVEQNGTPPSVPADGDIGSKPPAVSTTSPMPLVVQVPVADLHPHPLTSDVPRMREDERAELVADVRERGVQEPLRVQQGGLVLDGRERLDAARLRGDSTVPAIVVDLDDEQQREYVYAAAAARQLTDDQRAALAARLRVSRLPQERSDRARKGGKAGGRGRPKESSDSSAHAPSPELSPVGEHESAASRPESADTGAEAAPRPDAGTEAPEAPKPGAHWVEDTSHRQNLPVRKLKRALDLERRDPDLANKVLQGDLTLSAAGKLLPSTPPSTTVAGRGAKKSGKGAAPKPRRMKEGLLLPRATAPADARTALTKYFGADWLGELAGGVAPPAEAARELVTSEPAAAAGAPGPAHDRAGQGPVGGDGGQE
jgi:hypothetical protein